MKLPDHVIYPFQSKSSLRKRYGQTLAKLGAVNEKIVVLDADLSTSTMTSLFAEQFPHRHFDMGIAEADMMGTAAGLAATGLIPFASTFAMFGVGRAYDQIRNSIAYADLPVRIVLTHTGITVGEDGGSHQMLEDIAIMRMMPNMSVIVPADAHETEQAIRFSVDYSHPIYIRLTRSDFPDIYNDSYSFNFGKWDIIKQGSNKVVIITCGLMVANALEAAEDLLQKNIDATVINASTVDPIDTEMLIKTCEKARLVVTAEEALIAGGLGGGVAECLGNSCPRPLLRIGIDNRFGESGKSADLLEAFELTPFHIVKKILDKWNDLNPA